LRRSANIKVRSTIRKSWTHAWICSGSKGISSGQRTFYRRLGVSRNRAISILCYFSSPHASQNLYPPCWRPALRLPGSTTAAKAAVGARRSAPSKPLPSNGTRMWTWWRNSCSEWNAGPISASWTENPEAFPCLSTRGVFRRPPNKPFRESHRRFRRFFLSRHDRVLCKINPESRFLRHGFE